MRPGQLVLQGVWSPLVGLMLLALRTVAVATSMLDAVVPPTAGALREAVTVLATAARLDGAEDRAVRGGEGGVAFQRGWRTGVKDIAEGGHDRSLPSCVDTLSG